MPFLREPTHLLLVLLVLILLFGAMRLPDSARSLAKSLKIFKTEMKDINADEKKAEEKPDEPKKADEEGDTKK